jgi:MFS family permease
VSVAWRTPQFWLLWAVLCLNVSAGIGVLGMASPMLQEVFGGKLIGGEGALATLSDIDKSSVATIAAGFLGVLSLANILGRIGWASLSDRIGRRWTYFTFFGLGIVMYALVPFAGRIGSIAIFVSLFCVILTMYGGGFATIPAYLADLFGTQYVSAIHGRLLTAWSTAGILGPTLVNALREVQLAHGVPAAQAYNATMYILAGLLVVGLLSNTLVRPVDAKHFMSDAEIASLRSPTGGDTLPTAGGMAGRSPLKVGAAWLLVGLPMGWGFWVTLERASQLFR